MGRMGSTTSVRARQMRRVLARWQRSGLTLREFGEKRGIPLSTLTWWRRVFRRAGEEEGNGVSRGEPGGVHRSATAGEAFQGHQRLLEIVLHSGHLVRVPAGADTDTLQRVLQALQTTC